MICHERYENCVVLTLESKYYCRDKINAGYGIDIFFKGSISVCLYNVGEMLILFIGVFCNQNEPTKYRNCPLSRVC